MSTSTDILKELEEQLQAIQELKAMSREELDKVPYHRKKWQCQAKGCTNGTHIRDYGIEPQYFLDRKNGYWIVATERYYLCGKHGKMYKHLIKSFTHEAVCDKLLEHKSPLTKIVEVK